MNDRADPALQPALIQEGLAIYDRGQGEPLLLMPYPHAFTRVPMVEGPLARRLLERGRRLITFDPPGAYRSTRPARVDMPEMLACTLETLEATAVRDRVDVVGHSMGSLCALGWSLEYPERVNRLVLVGSMSGYPAVRRWGMPHNWRWWRDANYWRFVWWGARLLYGWGNLAVHKRLDRLIQEASFVDASLAPRITIGVDDAQRPAPVRDRWLRNVRRIDYSGGLDRVQAPAFVCVGLFDPQTPPPCSEELVRGIPKAHQVVFERSGHSPFVEEPERFVQQVSHFLES